MVREGEGNGMEEKRGKEREEKGKRKGWGSEGELKVEGGGKEKGMGKGGKVKRFKV